MSEIIEQTLETLPHSLTMEQAVIGGLLTGEGWEDVSGLLTEQDFYSPSPCRHVPGRCRHDRDRTAG